MTPEFILRKLPGTPTHYEVSCVQTQHDGTRMLIYCGSGGSVDAALRSAEANNYNGMLPSHLMLVIPLLAVPKT